MVSHYLSMEEAIHSKHTHVVMVQSVKMLHISIPYIKSLASLEASPDGMVRGELIVSRKDWTNISSTYANARNFVSGKVNRKHPEQADFQYLHSVCGIRVH